MATEPHVAGILAGNGTWSKGGTYTFGGMAPGANLVDLRALDNTGSGTDSSVIAAIQRAIALQKIYNIRVINLSLGRPVFESYTLDPLCQAVEQAWKAGIVVVAAGNPGRNNSANTNGYGTITAPGNDPYVITVGALSTVGTLRTMGTATRGDDLIASYSSKGPTLFDHVVKPDLVAPGNQVISTCGRVDGRAGGRLLDQLHSLLDFRAGRLVWIESVLLLDERHQHGGASSQRRGRAAAAAESESDAGSGESAAHEDRHQELSRLQHRHRPRYGHDLYQLLRPVYSRGRLPECVGRVE